MNKHKFLASLLSLVLVLTTIMPGTSASAATSGSSSGMEISKTATANDNGTYTIKLEAYATGSKVITEVTEDIPTDIILVLDQSGSMENSMSSTNYEAYASKNNSEFYGYRHNGGDENLYYKLDNGGYVQVSVNISNVETSYQRYTGSSNSDFYNNRSNIYVKDSDGNYNKVSIDRDWEWTGILKGEYEYTYTINGTRITASGNTVPSGYEFYIPVADYTNATYSYSYNSDGTPVTIVESVGENQVCNTTFYRLTGSANTSRLAALKNAVTTFTNNVAQKSAGSDGDITTTNDNINHRIAVVGFASGTYYNGRDYNYGNTEIFIGSNQYRYGTASQNVYASAFQNMDTIDGKDNVAASINALDADGGTIINLGIEMANGIFNSNPIPENQKRNRVVIVFTDGTPGWSGYDSSVATSAITEGNISRDTYGATVYTVGIFNGADATSAGNSKGDDTEKANWFMQNLSNNEGTVQSPSYYLSAANAETLNNIFQQISDQIESGGTSATLSKETVIKDIIAPAFELSEGADVDSIDVETWSCTGKNGDAYTWSKNDTAMDAAVTVNTVGDEISVSGFDFAENYVGTVTEGSKVTYRGSKLVISFTVTPKDGFLGGNNVYTNTFAGVYENESATDPVMEFERPQVNVPIRTVEVDPDDKNVYLLGDLTASQLKTGTAMVGNDTDETKNVKLDLDAENFGLQPWQNKYVDITVDSESDLSDLVNDQTYTMTVTVVPKESGENASGPAATEQSGSGTGNINVFKPELTFKDSVVYYGDTAPTDFSSNLDSTVWKHGQTVADINTMGDAPALLIESSIADSDSEKVADGKVNTKQDIKVDSVVKIGETDVSSYTQFQHPECDLHSDCADNCSWAETALDGKPAFLLHVKTCTLTVSKTGEHVSEEPFVLEVYKDGSKYTELTIVGTGSVTIKELPVGTYTLKEDTNWAWRYTSEITNNGVLTSDNPTGTVTCKNTPSKDKWFNEFSTVIENVFGVN